MAFCTSVIWVLASRNLSSAALRASVAAVEDNEWWKWSYHLDWMRSARIYQCYQIELYQNVELVYVYFLKLCKVISWIINWQNHLSEASADNCPSLSTIWNPMNPPPRVVPWSDESRFGFGISRLHKHIVFCNQCQCCSNQTGLRNVLIHFSLVGLS